jgi:hypothetical protein
MSIDRSLFCEIIGNVGKGKLAAVQDLQQVEDESMWLLK